MAKVLITGGAGYIGSVLAPAAPVRKATESSIFDSFMYGALPLLGFSSHPKLEIIKGDVRDATAAGPGDERPRLDSPPGRDRRLSGLRRRPALSITTNVDGTRNVLDAMGQGQRLIFASTGSTYGKVRRRGDRGDPDRTLDALRARPSATPRC